MGPVGRVWSLLAGTAGTQKTKKVYVVAAANAGEGVPEWEPEEHASSARPFAADARPVGTGAAASNAPPPGGSLATESSAAVGPASVSLTVAEPLPVPGIPGALRRGGAAPPGKAAAPVTAAPESAAAGADSDSDISEVEVPILEPLRKAAPAFGDGLREGYQNRIQERKQWLESLPGAATDGEATVVKVGARGPSAAENALGQSAAVTTPLQTFGAGSIGGGEGRATAIAAALAAARKAPETAATPLQDRSAHLVEQAQKWTAQMRCHQWASPPGAMA